MTEERCFLCGSVTCHAGYGDESLYDGEYGPFCEDCFDNQQCRNCGEQIEEDIPRVYISNRFGPYCPQCWEEERQIADEIARYEMGSDYYE